MKFLGQGFEKLEQEQDRQTDRTYRQMRLEPHLRMLKWQLTMCCHLRAPRLLFTF